MASGDEAFGHLAGLVGEHSTKRMGNLRGVLSEKSERSGFSLVPTIIHDRHRPEARRKIPIWTHG